jgi:hypothetical protein
MSQATIDDVLLKIAANLHLSKETEHEMLAEIRTHLEEAVAEAVGKGTDEQTALLNAAEQFGVEQAAAELQEVHIGQESLDAIAMVAVPVLFALLLRWLAFTPEGSARNWQQLLTRPGFWIIAATSLIIPGLWFRRRRYALAGWIFFWLLTVIFIIFPSINQW